MHGRIGNWQKTETKPDVFSLESLIAWLERQPAETGYSTLPLSSCMLGQFAAAMGADDVVAASFDLGSAAKFADIAFPHNVADLTFGAALSRARAALVASANQLPGEGK